MSARIFQRSFATTTRARATISSPLSSLPPTHFSASNSSVPKLGKVGKWYLPTMALIAVGMIYLPDALFTSPATTTRSPRTVTLDSANRTIGFAISNALSETNLSQKKRELTQVEKNQLLMDAYGARSTLEDIEKAFEQMERAATMDSAERNSRLEDAYGERTSLRDVERAMQVYEVQ
ncbi:hypothetical protein B0J11DRAFT_441373 [Dendryphion nanum]|uniref:Uncharacterized protein n=1 Tax=Dendryphion nanum TaxID=256645 RepID=A0A9P9DCC7_9PLEO|nr:hypothetical protein B0J11DRAFT_441373 [Dendryphion nanum]